MLKEYKDEHYKKRTPEENRIEMAILDCKNGEISAFSLIKDLNPEVLSKYGISNNKFEEWEKQYQEYSELIS